MNTYAMRLDSLRPGSASSSPLVLLLLLIDEEGRQAAAASGLNCLHTKTYCVSVNKRPKLGPNQWTPSCTDAHSRGIQSAQQRMM